MVRTYPTTVYSIINLFALYSANCNSRKSHVALLVTSSAWVRNLYKDSSIYNDSISRLYCLFCHQESKIVRTMVYSSTPDTLSMASICYLYRPVHQRIDGVLWQSERENSGLANALGKLFAIYSVFMILSLGGLIYAHY